MYAKSLIIERVHEYNDLTATYYKFVVLAIKILQFNATRNGPPVGQL